MTQRHELHCNTCNHYVQFSMDMAVNADYYISCPTCQREHCRVVYNHNIVSHQKNAARGFPLDVPYHEVTSSTIPTTQGNQPHSHTWQ